MSAYRLAAVSAVLLVLAGCGEGGDKASSSAAPATATTTVPAPTESTPVHSDDDPALRDTVDARNYIVALQKKCAALHTKRVAPLPIDPKLLRRWAASVGPVAQKIVAMVATGKHPQEVNGAVEQLVAAYQQFLPLLAQIQAAPPGGEEIKRIAPLIPAALRNIQAVSAGMGAPACGF